MTRYSWTVPPVRDGGKTSALTMELGRRMRAAGYGRLDVRGGDWPCGDARDYAPDAPDRMPAGSCIDSDDFGEQRIAYRDHA